MPVTDNLSIQLYTLRAMNDLDAILDAVVAAGYRFVEGVGAHLDDALTLKAKTDARGLRFSSSHVSLAALRERPQAVIAACQVLGFQDLFMPAVPPEQRNLDGGFWLALGRELGEHARCFADAGIRLGYHNHDWELRPKAGTTTALELVFGGAEGSPLTWQADVAWLVRGGAEPTAWLERYRDRLASAHVKDIAPAGTAPEQDGWADVGSGVLDWRALWTACRANGARWMVVEHDKPADPAHSVRASFAFIAAMEH
jgi:sugar phosphate isomerase/epimerase